MKGYIILLMAVLLITACAQEQQTDQQTDTTDQLDQQTTDQQKDQTTDDVMDRYAGFEAAMACDLARAAKAEDPDAMMQAMQNAGDYATDYGFTSEEIPALTQQYEDDPQFALLAQQKMQEMCPEIVSALS